MSKALIRVATHVGEYFDKAYLISMAKRTKTEWKKDGYPEQHSPDFKPELIQDHFFQTAMYVPYISDKDYYRVYMPLREDKPEENTKYINDIIQVVNKYIPHLVSNFFYI